MFYPFFDVTQILVLPALAFALWAQWKVQSTYRRFAQVPAANGLTGREMARSIMVRNGVTDVAVEEIQGTLNDHYDPRSKTVRLSQPIYEGSSISSIAVAAHEIGHVLQHANGYVPLGIRSALAPVAGFGSMLAFPLFFIGFIFRSPALAWLMDLGILFFLGALVFQLITLPVEFDASKRALAQLTATGAIAPDEVAGAKRVLDAAALTYVAAAAMAALQVIRLLVLRNSRN
ncbi:MAG: zinc metallopeptidase [Candidatus Eisenbacteria bacterium]|uniref:Zinc metallopeptidase n=1 Tax=Eiseniibacteriota bacterium TaxID=2212470 RepID=A0A9D6QHX5_UNCEI|nr:zinc metallopeptidase [Candidatus Eisenbacteria bacterium]